MSSPTSYMACHDCKEPVATCDVVEINVQPLYADDIASAEASGMTIVRRPLRAFVCKSCYEDNHAPPLPPPAI